MPVYTAELFPTVVRNLGVGSSNVAAGIALVLVPFLWNLVSKNGSLLLRLKNALSLFKKIFFFICEQAKIDFRLPMALLGSFGVIGGVSVLFLEETANRPMLNTLEEGENL